MQLAGNNWSEEDLSWKQRPPLSTGLGLVSRGTVPDTTYSTALDISGLHLLLGGSGTLALVGAGSDSLYVWSREHPNTAYRPQLTLTFSPAPRDTTPPTPPYGLTAKASGRTAELSWTASREGNGVTVYDVHRSNNAGFAPSRSTVVKTLSATSAKDTPPGSGTWHYLVVARDAAGNPSRPSEQASVVVFVPVNPTVVVVRPTADSFANEGAMSSNFGTSSSLSSRGHLGAVIYLRYAVPRPPIGKTLSRAILHLHTTTATSAGSADAHTVRLAAEGWSEAGLTWKNKPRTASALGVLAGVTRPNTGYETMLDAARLQPLLGRTGSLALTSTGTDSLYVWSREHATVSSRPTLSLTFSQVVADRTPPSAPDDVTATSSMGGVKVSWTASTDNRGVIRYELHRSERTGTALSSETLIGTSTTHEFTDRPRTPGIWYYRVVALDDAGNRSAPSAAASVAVELSSQGLCGFLGGTSTITKTMTIWLGNRDRGAVIGAPAAPYVNMVARQCGVASNYTSGTHPSLPNYLTAVSGGAYAKPPWTGSCPASHCRTNQPSIFEQVGSGRWRGYAESMPANCRRTDSGPYAVRHNPAAYFSKVAAACVENDVPLGTPARGALRNHLASGDLADYTFVVPDLDHDMHRGSIRAGDTWLSQWLPLITASADYREGRLAVLLAWDEGSGDGAGVSSKVPFVVLSAFTPPGTVSDTAFNHFSLLRLTEEVAGVPLLGGAASATRIRPDFGL